MTPEQIARFGLPTVPPKPTDRRSFTGETVQAEALPPDELARIVRAGIENRIDHEQLAATLADERAVQSMSRAEIARLIQQLSDD